MNLKIADVFDALEGVADPSDYTIYVETGTGSGGSLIEALAWKTFKSLRTIELSEPRWRKAIIRIARNRLARVVKYNKEIVIAETTDARALSFNCGDSATVLEAICPGFTCPAFFHLDAHYCTTKAGDAAPNQFPLWKELETIKARLHPDIISVDDVHTFGKLRPDFGTNDNPENWHGVTAGSLAAFMAPRVEMSVIVGDVFVMKLKKGTPNAE